DETIRQAAAEKLSGTRSLAEIDDEAKLMPLVNDILHEVVDAVVEEASADLARERTWVRGIEDGAEQATARVAQVRAKLSPVMPAAGWRVSSGGSGVGFLDGPPQSPLFEK